ncbi:MAG: serine/threonine protein kinase [Myxococcales bacterium]|nr:serine/threonine protein kinase [Myxococcales bacterium]
MIGTVIADTYRVLERLDVGVSGELYLIEHAWLGRRLMVKVLPPDQARDPVLAACFRREARALNGLHHAHVIGVEDFGTLPGGGLYLVMELAVGESLERILDRAPGHRLPIGRAVELCAQLASAVDYLHGRRVIHRDLEPANLLVVPDGEAEVLKVLGFGLASALDAGHREDEVSRRGYLLGSPAYLAPERQAGVHDDPRSDLYAIGCVIHALVAGSPPFVGTTLEVLASHEATEPPRLRERAADVPPALDDLVARLLAKDPGQRPRSDELAQALRQSSS